MVGLTGHDLRIDGHWRWVKGRLCLMHARPSMKGEPKALTGPQMNLHRWVSLQRRGKGVPRVLHDWEVACWDDWLIRVAIGVERQLVVDDLCADGCPHRLVKGRLSLISIITGQARH